MRIALTTCATLTLMGTLAAAVGVGIDTAAAAPDQTPAAPVVSATVHEAHPPLVVIGPQPLEIVPAPR